jgi:hypothetical protein
VANTLTAVIPQLLAQGLMALRQRAVTPRLVNTRYESLAGPEGSTIDVPIPSAITAVAVSPAATPPATADIAPTSVAIALDQWYEAPFQLSDKEALEVMAGTIPMQASEAIKAIGNNVDNYLLGQYKKFYGWQGTAGTTPFASDTSDATGLRKTLFNQLAPNDDRHVIFDPDAEAQALDLRAFQDASWTGDIDAIINGKLNDRLGFQWWMDQNVATHTAGVPGGTPLTTAVEPIGETSIPVDGMTATTGTYLEGDIITFAGHTQTYVVTADATADGGGAATLVIAPGLQVSVGNNVAITLKADHVANIGFHRDAIAFATRPLTQDTEGLGAITVSATDPVTGLSLRLEVTREHKRRRYSYDILYGANVVRRELGARLAG